MSRKTIHKNGMRPYQFKMDSDDLDRFESLPLKQRNIELRNFVKKYTDENK
jgi:hypothetical protein